MTDEKTTPDVVLPEGFELSPFDYGFTALAMPFYIKHEPQNVTLGFHVLDHHVNPGQIAHGGMLMTMIDMAFGINVGIRVKDAGFLPTTGLSFDFLKPAMLGNWIESKIDFVHLTRKTAVVSGFLIGPDGPIVRASGTNKIMRKDDPQFQVADSVRGKFADQRNINHD
jgi:uncharacterized protein (TIGR00369 family)